MHLWSKDGGEATHRLVVDRRVGEHARSVEDGTHGRSGALNACHQRLDRRSFGHIAADRRERGVINEPRPVRLAAALHAAAAGGEDETLGTALDQHSGGQQAEAAEAAGEEVRSLLELPVDAVLSLCDLSHYHCLGLEGPRATSHAVSAVKAARSEQPPPVLPGHERTLLPRALWIARKEPPAVGQAKSRLSKAARLEQLVDKQTPART
mmetsp:Transcript_15184/g.49296  ORF Transcript_15184/g.49296 Transcript_15184/m.49296 type:complete len:209 (-) Transcript_15184:1904-2530(-)